MNIIIGNQKGGVGKTTHAILLSNYLALEKQKELLLLDLDFQGSLKNKWEQDQEIFDNQPLYQVMQLDLEQISSLLVRLKNVEGLIVFDLPGKIDDNHLVAVYQNADLVICPFSYDKLTFESTLVFSQLIKHLNMEVPIVFLPNRLKKSVNYTIKMQVDNTLINYGEILPAVTDRVAMQRFDCFTISDEAMSIINRPYSYIFEKYLARSVETINPSTHE